MSVHQKIVCLPSDCFLNNYIDEHGDFRTDLWKPKSIGDWEVDNAYGRDALQRCINFLSGGGSQAVVFALMRTMIGKGHFSGVEAGFITELVAMLAVRSPASQG